MFTILDVVLEVNPDSHDLLQKLILDVVQKESPDFPDLQKVPHLHFMSMQIFEDPHYDPLFIFENNFDGDSEAYWAEVLKVLGSDLRQMFACSKAALDPKWASLFKTGSKLSLIPFIKEFSVSPSASHIGAVGIPVARIKRDSAFFDEAQKELGIANGVYASGSISDLHQNLRQWAAGKFPWFSEPETAPIGKGQQRYRFANLKTLVPKAGVVLLVFAALLVAAVFMPRLSQIIGIAAVTLLVVGIAFAWWSVATLRSLENTDYNQAKPALDPEQLADFARFEDQIVQNHLASMVLVKPGTLRSMIIHAALYALKLYVPFANYDGYLGAMRTIHFAHWTLIGNGGRLLFFSNFDGSWQSYLDDFVDKAAAGLTLAWGNCVGFPETKWLVKDGAAHGTQFKAWARQSQTLSPMWYSAYRTLTVNQIIRNAAIVDGLRKAALTSEEANKWATLL
ncbi:hypothetical protein HNQ77_001637 [Silvibacterium bohemicum]|uniref:Uncharacterized protein n=1 Tax=Silvibacterium bohemicum TaxID=1577686 RepID=A0A841JZ31_9BACT|nr:hypothetical protein [Silvibacterium bohemicum]MBB6143688.1 hypothetical protein [Silvibacterium bohemicum]